MAFRVPEGCLLCVSARSQRARERSILLLIHLLIRLTRSFSTSHTKSDKKWIKQI